MFVVLQVVCVFLVAVALALSLAHALECARGSCASARTPMLPRRRSIIRGFTVGGAAEPLGILALLVLAFVTPAGMVFWLTLAALFALAASHLTYWVMTHPVNNFWLKDHKVAAGSGFFSFAARGIDTSDWTALRDRWEMSHLIRAAFAGASFVLLVIAVAIGP